jgi:hypothetical protein
MYLLTNPGAVQFSGLAVVVGTWSIFFLMAFWKFLLMRVIDLYNHSELRKRDWIFAIWLYACLR